GTRRLGLQGPRPPVVQGERGEAVPPVPERPAPPPLGTDRPAGTPVGRRTRSGRVLPRRRLSRPGRRPRPRLRRPVAGGVGPGGEHGDGRRGAAEIRAGGRPTAAVLEPAALVVWRGTRDRGRRARGRPAGAPTPSFRSRSGIIKTLVNSRRD